MAIFQVDVWFCTEANWPIHIDKSDWRRYVVDAPDADSASLVANQMAMMHGHVAQFVIVDWEE